MGMDSGPTRFHQVEQLRGRLWRTTMRWGCSGSVISFIVCAYKNFAMKMVLFYHQYIGIQVIKRLIDNKKSAA